MSAILDELGDDLPVRGPMEALARLDRDLRASAKLLSPSQARWLVDRYYQIQQERIRAAGQIRSEGESQEPNALLQWMLANFETLENDIRRALDVYSMHQEAGRWARSICGIGPVIAAGLLAHVYDDVARGNEPTVGHLWAWAGLDPSKAWSRNQKRPWNASLKVLCYKVGESFVKVQNRPADVYGQVYAARKQLELERNATGQFREQAAAALTAKRYGTETVARAAYERGELPAAHLHARARRYAVKLFLAHFHQVSYEIAFGERPPKPYILDHGGHAHFIAPPNWPMR